MHTTTKVDFPKYHIPRAIQEYKARGLTRILNLEIPLPFIGSVTVAETLAGLMIGSGILLIIKVSLALANAITPYL